MTSVERFLVLRLLQLIQAWDRLRLRRLQRRHPGLEIHPSASTNFATAEFLLAPGAQLRIGAGATTERRHHGIRFELREGARVEIDERAWLRTEIEGVHVRAFEGAQIRLGREGQLNGCMVSAKLEVSIDDRSMIGMGSRVFDSDQHALDVDRPEVSEPVRIGKHVWIAADVSVLRGATIGDHCVIGTRSVVRGEIPPHTLAVGAPAKPVGRIKDRSQVPL